MDLIKIISAVGFPILTIIFYTLLFKEIRTAIYLTHWTDEKKKRILSRFLIGLLLWASAVTVASLTGFTSNFEIFPVNAMPLLLFPLLTTIVLLFTNDMKAIVAHLNIKVITQLQVFRVFVELILWALFIQNLLPVQMTFEGRNFDIIAGITAILAARFLLSNKGGMIAWNIFGLALLINIVATALLSMPTPFRVFHNEPANIIVTYFPYIFLPTFLVPLAYILHFLSLKKLLIKS